LIRLPDKRKKRRNRFRRKIRLLKITRPTAATVPQPDTVAGNASVLGKAQQAVLQQPQTTPLQQATNTAAMNWLQNPSGTYDPQQVKQATLEGADQRNADSMEAMRRQYGNVSGSGLFQKDVLDNVLRQNVSQAELGAALDKQNYDVYVDSLGRSQQNAQALNQQEENIFSQRIGNMSTVRGMAENERAQQTEQQNTIELSNLGYDQTVQAMALQNGYDLAKLDKQYGQQMATMIAQNDWQAVQAELNRQTQLAAQSKDITAQQNLLKLKNDLDMVQLDKQYGLNLQATMQSQAFQASEAALNRAVDLAMRTGDIQAQKDLALLQNQLQSQLITQEQAFQASEAVLNRMAETAKLTGNIQAQKDLAVLQSQLQTQQNVQGQGFQAAQAELDRAFELATQNNDNAAKEKLTRLQGDLDLQKMDRQYGLNLQAAIQNQDWQAGQTELDRAAEAAAQSKDIQAQKEIQSAQNAFDWQKLNATQDWQSQQNKISNDLQIAMQSNDIQATASNIQKQLDLDKWRQENGQEFTAEQSAINNALQVTLQTMDSQAQKNLVEMKAAIDAGTLLNQQDFQAIQADLDRQQKLAIQSNDANLQREILTTQAAIEQASRTAQNKFVSAERAATQAWQTGERLSDQEYTTAMQYYDWAQKNAAQTNDIEAQKYVEQMRMNTELSMQTAGMKQEEKMAYINAQIQQAAADDDMLRQQQLLEYSYAQDLNKIAVEFGNDAALAQIQGAISQKLQAGEYAHAEAMQNTLLQHQAQQAALDRSVQKLEIAMQAQGIDLAAEEQGWNQVKDAVAAGADPQALYDYLKNASQTANITFEPIDQIEVYKELQNQMTAMRQEYGLTHPEYVKDAATGELTDSGKIAFNEFYNTQMFNAKNEISSPKTTAEAQADAYKMNNNARKW
jgi:hypothetical protein